MTEYKIYDRHGTVICHDFCSVAGTESGIRMLLVSTMAAINGQYAAYRRLSSDIYWNVVDKKGGNDGE